MSFWELVWLIIISFLFIAYLMVLFSIIGDIFRSQDMSGVLKGLWIFALIFLPMLTALIYLISRGNGMAERSNKANVETAKMILAAQPAAAAASSSTQQIADAKGLLDSGAITADEFEALKKKALA